MSRDVWDDPRPGDVLVVGRLTFQMTCWACPEQYDVWLGERQVKVAYVHLRHGRLDAWHPDEYGRLVYRDEVEDFYSAGERREALAAIAAVIEGALAA